MLPACPTCKAPVTEPDRVYKVTVEPGEGERGVIKKDVGMFRCQRCDTTFPRVLGRIHYLLVPEAEHNRMKKEIEDGKAIVKRLEDQSEALRKEMLQREEGLAKQLRGGVISSLEAEIRQLEKNVKQLKSDKDKIQAELGE